MSAPDEVPMPDVKHLCQRCGVTAEDVERVSVVVSPRGTAHFGMDYGATACGNDATVDGWWWPI